VRTFVISELRRREPDPNVVEWFEQRPSTALFLSVLTLGEIRKGIELVTDSKRKLRLLDWLEMELPKFFAGRTLPVDLAVADRWGRLQADARRPLAAVDSLMAATALHHGLRMVTRNARDFTFPELAVINPWID
jgi:predicted nucleic acid-binding protein